MAGSRSAVHSRFTQLETRARSAQTQLPIRSTRPGTCNQHLRPCGITPWKAPKMTYYSSSTSDESNNTPALSKSRDVFLPLDTFARRHIGPSPTSTEQMLKALDPPASTLDEFVKQVLPRNILSLADLKIDGPPKGSLAETATISEEGYSESQ